MYQVYALKYGERDTTACQFFYRESSHEPLTLHFYVWLILGGPHPVLVDVGGHAAEAEARGLRGYVSPATMVERLGVKAADVPLALITHLHWDHWAGHGAFPAAEFWIQREEVAFWTGPAARYEVYRQLANAPALGELVTLNYGKRLRLLDGDREVLPGLAVHRVGGHTAGLQVVSVATAAGRVVLTSDASHFYRNIERRQPVQIITDLPEMLAAFDTIDGLAGAERLVVAGHEQRWPIDTRSWSAASSGSPDTSAVATGPGAMPTHEGPRVRWRRATLVALLAVLVAGTFLRIHWNDVYEYSTADETIYRDYARFLASSGWGAYPILVAAYLATPPVWTSPPPLRYGHFAIISAVCAAARQCEYRTLAWVSTVAGIAMILVTYAIGRHFFGEPIGLLAAALVVTSPLQLGLGRRALQDELAALFAVAAAAALLWARDAAPVRWMTALRTTAAVLLGAAALAVKESYLIFYPGLVAAYAVGIRTRGIRWRDGLLFVAPPLLYVTGFVASSRSLASFFAAARTLVGSIPGNEYVLAYEAGPPHRPLFDLFVLSPLVCLAAVAAVTLVLGHRDEAAPGPKRFSALVVGLFIVYALVSKNLRYSVAADTLVRILAAWALWVYLLPRRRLAPAAVVFVLASGLAEILVFRAIFVLGGVYDPVTLVLLRGLGAIPRGPILP